MVSTKHEVTFPMSSACLLFDSGKLLSSGHDLLSLEVTRLGVSEMVAETSPSFSPCLPAAEEKVFTSSGSS